MKYLLLGLVIIAGLFMFGFRSGGDLVSYEELQQKMNSQESFALVDVRTEEEFAQGHIPGAILLSHDQIEAKALTVLPDKEKPVIVYCRSGRRSAIAVSALDKLGYASVRDFGGISRWQGALER